MWGFLKKFKCNFNACCKSKCSLNAEDTDNNGWADTLYYGLERDGKVIIEGTKVISSV